MTPADNAGPVDKAEVRDPDRTATGRAASGSGVAAPQAASSPRPTEPSPTRKAEPAHAHTPPATSKWRQYGTPLVVVLLAAAVVITITRNWNAWQGGRIEQVTDDAYVQGDITPLGTKAAGIVRDVKVSDYQQVHKGEILVELESNDFQARVAQATSAVEAARAAIEDNRRQRELSDTRIQQALAGVDGANAQIGSAQDSIEAVRAEVVRTQKERKRQEALFQTQSTTEQNLEKAVADEERFAAELSNGQARLQQAQALLAGNQLAVEAEKRSKAVLESQEARLLADLHAREDALTVAKIDLGYTTIAAPDDGTVGEKQVRPGQLVAPGTEVIPFVNQIKWVQANYLETQLTNVKVGDAAKVRIDEYPGRVFAGKVTEIAPASGSQFALLPPDNATGNFTKVVQRIPVRITLDDASIAAALRPGLSVVATVRTRP